VSSTVSEVSAPPAVSSAQRLQTSMTTQSSDSEPFAALLHATAASPATANASANPQPAVQGTPASGGKSAGKVADTGSRSTAGTSSPSGANVNPGTTNVSNTPPIATNVPSNAVFQPDASVGNGTDTAPLTDLAQAVASILNAAAAKPGTPPVPATKTPAADAKNDQSGAGSAATGDSVTATAASPAQAAANVSQPVAAVVIVNNAANAAPAAGCASASGTAIGQSTRARAKVTLPLGGDQGALPTQTKDGAPAQQPPSASKTGGANNIESGSPGDTANTQAPSGSSPQQAQGPTADDAVMPPQTDASAPTDGNHATARADALSAPSPVDAAGLSGAQTANGTAKTDGLPNFGFSAANTATPSAAAATPGSAAAAAVPVAGLAVAIAVRAKAGSNQFDIRLDPPELGRIDVRLDVDRNGQVTSHITVDRADTLQLLQSQQPQLESALQQAGLRTADNGLQFTLRDQSFAGQNGSSSGQPSAAQLVIPDAELAPVEATQIYSRWGLGSGIDIRV